MQTLILVAVALTLWLAPATAQDSEESAADLIFKELMAGLPRDGQRGTSARLELEYWHEHQWGWLKPPARKPVKTREGKAAEIVFLSAPAMSMPGTDFSMALLVVDKRVVDWASCWTSNRVANQESVLEDVDGDGFSDVAFRASDGWWGLLDKRQHSRPGDKRKWLYAYAVTAKGFQSLFPNTERDLKVVLSYDTAGRVVLQINGLPEFLHERQMVECKLSATNTSDKELVIKPGRWFEVDMGEAAYFMTYSPPDERAVLKPGETVSQVIRLYVEGPEAENELTMSWKFVRSR